MELLGLANPKRNALGRIASLTERPSKNKAERSEAKTPGAGFPRPKGQADEDGGAGTTPSETAAAAKCPITRYVNRAVRQERGPERWPGGEAPAAPKPGSHNVGLDDERRAQSRGHLFTLKK
jgi:hypothetical protein